MIGAGEDEVGERACCCGVVVDSVGILGLAVAVAIAVPETLFSFSLPPSAGIDGLSVCCDGDAIEAVFAVDLRRGGGGFTANSCAPGTGGGRKEDDGEGKGDAEAGVSMCNDRGRDGAK